jgi:hypothetical protein
MTATNVSLPHKAIVARRLFGERLGSDHPPPHQPGRARRPVAARAGVRSKTISARRLA